MEVWFWNGHECLVYANYYCKKKINCEQEGWKGRRGMGFYNWRQNNKERSSFMQNLIVGPCKKSTVKVWSNGILYFLNYFFFIKQHMKTYFVSTNFHSFTEGPNCYWTVLQFKNICIDVVLLNLIYYNIKKNLKDLLLDF